MADNHGAKIDETDVTIAEDESHLFFNQNPVAVGGYKKRLFLMNCDVAMAETSDTCDNPTRVLETLKVPCPH